MTTMSSTGLAVTRLMAVAEADAAVALPALANAPRAQTVIGGLWVQAETLKLQLAQHRTVVAAKAAEGGIAGWMREG